MELMWVLNRDLFSLSSISQRMDCQTLDVLVPDVLAVMASWVIDSAGVEEHHAGTDI